MDTEICLLYLTALKKKKGFFRDNLKDTNTLFLSYPSVIHTCLYLILLCLVNIDNNVYYKSNIYLYTKLSFVLAV